MLSNGFFRLFSFRNVQSFLATDVRDIGFLARKSGYTLVDDVIKPVLDAGKVGNSNDSDHNLLIKITFPYGFSNFLEKNFDNFFPLS